MKRSWLIVFAAVAIAPVRARAADGQAPVLVSKSITSSTVALIDPESGASGGSAGSDTKVAIGDVISFRFKYFPVPSKILRGIAGYLTEFLPPNTQLVGARFIDSNGNTILPYYPGLTSTAAIARSYAETGLFYATTVSRTPSDAFITLQNGSQLSPAPAFASVVAPLVGTTAPFFAHDAWDLAQVGAFGTAGGAAPVNYGSAVAGPDAFYKFQAPNNSNTNGPWSRIVYPGSTVGSATLTPSAAGAFRAIAAAPGGVDLVPKSPLTASALRFAGGEIRTGVPVETEVFLKVTGLPLDPGMNEDVDCGEAFGGDTSGRNPPQWNTGASDGVWNFYIPSPACVFLNLLFDLSVDKTLAPGSGTLNYTLHGRNLSTKVTGQHNAVAQILYDTRLVVSSTGTTAGFTSCGTGCIQWALGNLAPSADYVLTARFTYTGGNGADNVTTFAKYLSTELPDGFVTQAQTMITGISVIDATMVSPTTSVTAGTTKVLSGTLTNPGTADTTISTLAVVLPSGWTISGNATINGSGETCDKDPVTGTNTSTCGTSRVVFDGLSLNLPAGGSRAFSFTVSVPGGAAAALYPIELETISSQTSYGGSPETYFRNVAIVPVGKDRAAPPVLSCNLVPSVIISYLDATIRGTSSEPDGTTITLYFNGIARATGTVSGGKFAIAVPTGTFGSLYAGLEVRATADKPDASGSKLESPLSTACFVRPATSCTDGVDNDGDGKCDFAGCYIGSVFLQPDPGCTSAADSDEADLQCANGIDDDGDGKCDYAGCTIASVVLPPDPQCWSPWDNTENSSGDTPTPRPACMDGVDNDNDGTCDFAGCIDAGKGLSLPPDPGCHAPNDTDEVPPVLVDDKTRLLLIVDTSGSMNWNTCSDHSFPGGDGSLECAGSDVSCGTCNATGCGNTKKDDTRLYKVKTGLANVISAFGEVTYALMRFKQTPTDFACPGTNATFPSGGWQGSSAVPGSLENDPNRCGSYNAGELLSRFSVDNPGSIVEWLDHQSNWTGGGAVPPSLDLELRASGTTPLAGSLKSAYDYLLDPTTGVRTAANDPILACRPYGVILLTDGVESCGGDPVTRAKALADGGVPVYVIGFAIADQADKDRLDAIAASGNTQKAVFVDESAALSAAIAGIVQKSVKVEICNGVDDNCNQRIDEGFGRWQECITGSDCGSGTCDQGRCVCTTQSECAAGFTCGAIGTATKYCLPSCSAGSSTCKKSGVKKGCAGGCFENDGLAEGTSAPLTSTPPTETCNGLDDNCDGIIDNCGDSVARSCCPACPACAKGGPFPETCNGCDDDCNGTIDDNPVDTGIACGITVGVCTPGSTICSGGVLGCSGGTDGSTEVCDGVDNDCNGRTDEVTRVCFTAPAPAMAGKGRCVAGRQACQGCGGASAPCSADQAQWGACVGEVGPIAETCNNVDDDCDGVIDNDAPVANQGEACCPSGLDCAGAIGSACHTGTIQCVNGGKGCVGAVGKTPEICDGLDNDCNGIVDDVPGVDSPCNDDDQNGGTPTSIKTLGECRAKYVCDPKASGQGPLGLTCTQTIGPATEVCDGADNDCNGEVDDNPTITEEVCPGLQQSELDVLVAAGYTADQLAKVSLSNLPCDAGHTECVAGGLACVGRVTPQPNVCNGKSVDCTGEVNTNGQCPNGFDCFQGNCVTPCEKSEFPCAGGFVCDPKTNLCVPDGCEKLNCATGLLCLFDAETGMAACVDPCNDITCPAGSVCHLGVCQDDTCLTSGCPDGQLCVGKPAMCVDDACTGLLCTADQLCEAGMCEATCADGCPSGQLCQGGACVTDPCHNLVCGQGQACRVTDGVASCVADECGVQCAAGTVCCGGQCLADPCNGVHCADGQSCSVQSTCTATCNTGAMHGPMGQTQIVGAGGGGFGCNAGNLDTTWFGALAVAFALVSRRRKRRL